jgi:hypothetical protein
MKPDKAYPATQDIQMLNVTAKDMTKLVLKLDSSKASDSEGRAVTVGFHYNIYDGVLKGRMV